MFGNCLPNLEIIGSPYTRKENNENKLPKQMAALPGYFKCHGQNFLLKINN